MARTLKANGLKELTSIKRRVNRQYALGRIHHADATKLMEYLDGAENMIRDMQELNEEGEREVTETPF